MVTFLETVPPILPVVLLAVTVVVMATRLLIALNLEKSSAATATMRVILVEIALSPRTCPRFNAATVTSLVMIAEDVQSLVTTPVLSAKIATRWDIPR